jgi:hypothetical protein
MGSRTALKPARRRKPELVSQNSWYCDQMRLHIVLRLQVAGPSAGLGSSWAAAPH